MNSQVRSSRTKSPFFAKKLTERQIVTKRKTSLFCLVLIAATSAAAWNESSSMEAVAEFVPANNPLEVQTIVAQNVPYFARERSYTGIVHESQRSKISFQRGGEVITLLVDEGQRVELGQKLAEMDDRHIRTRRAQLVAQLAEVEAELAELLAGPRKETISAKRAELEALDAQTAVLEKQLARRKLLVENASVSREEYETFHYDFRAARARADVARRQLDEMLAGTRLEKIAAQRARKTQLDARLADVSYDLEDTVLVAPFSGRVSKRYLDEGTVVASGTPVLELIDDEQLEAWIGLPPAASLSLYEGNRQKLTVDGEQFEAEVYSLAPDVDRATRTQNVILRFVESSKRVLPGQVVRLSVSEQVDQAGYWVPTTALTRGTRGLWSVYVVEDSQQKEIIGRRDVELLDTVGARSFVRGTLQQGDRIVASGTHRVVVGQHVTVSSDSVVVARHNKSALEN